ncbi:MAG: aspartate/glutamate racemase family protein [Planctomycetota bacterium]|jgi:aspartate racemase
MDTNHETLGIVGGFGPYAHIKLEEEILNTARRLKGACRDQDFPQWILSSLTETPDRVQYILNDGPDALTGVIESFRKLEDSIDGTGKPIKGADFAVMSCITAHKLLPEISKATNIEIVSIVEETVKHIADLMPEISVGILATNATVKTNLFQNECEKYGIKSFTPYDLPDGERIQKELVMDVIYGDWQETGKTAGGIKGLGLLPEHTEALQKVTGLLKDEFNITAVIAGCTELDCALLMQDIAGVKIIKPYTIISEYIIKRIYSL